MDKKFAEYCVGALISVPSVPFPLVEALIGFFDFRHYLRRRRM
jgi:hypothetical protein